MAFGSGRTLERMANPGALDGAGSEMLMRALGLANGKDRR